MKKIALGLSAAALAIAGTAYAAHHEGWHNPDADGDGIVTRAEHDAHASAMFARLDANNDGKLDQTDRDARREVLRTKMFDKLDADGNDSISRDEFMSHEWPHQGRHGMGGPGMGGPGMDGPDKHHRWGKRGDRGGPMKMMKMADTDNDGAITKAEFTAAADKRFEKIDANDDGKITQEERQAHYKEMRGKWHDQAGD